MKTTTMKTFTKLALAGITAALYTTGSVYADQWEVGSFSNAHGGVTYLYRRAEPTTQSQTTIAVFGNGKGIGKKFASHEDSGTTVRHFSTPNGDATYSVPVK